MIGHGIVMAGAVIPNTDRVIRDPLAWWGPGTYGARPRLGVPVDLGVGHWTAGEAGVKTGDDDGPFVVRVMKNRLSNDPARAAEGIRLKVSVHFVIGVTGQIWQTADPITTTCMHVGMGAVNSRSWSAEVVNPGTGPMHPARPRERIAHRMLPTPKLPRGRLVRQLAYYPEQIDAWIWLCEWMVTLTQMPRQVPMGADGGLEIDRFTKAEQRRWKGAMEHYHVPTTTKVDGGTQLIRALHERAGWPVVVP